METELDKERFTQSVEKQTSFTACQRKSRKKKKYIHTIRICPECSGRKKKSLTFLNAMRVNKKGKGIKKTTTKKTTNNFHHFQQVFLLYNPKIYVEFTRSFIYTYTHTHTHI